MKYETFYGEEDKKGNAAVVEALLKKEALRAHDIAQKLEIGLNYVHKYLNELKMQEIVVNKRFGQKVYWGLVAKEGKKRKSKV